MCLALRKQSIEPVVSGQSSEALRPVATPIDAIRAFLHDCIDPYFPFLLFEVDMFVVCDVIGAALLLRVIENLKV